MKPQKVNEGDWFAVPLREGGYALGVVARKGKPGILLGYFWGPRRDAVPALDEVRDLAPESAILIEQFGDLSLRDRTWPILGSLGSWDREKWPIPTFCRTDSAGRSWKVFYGDDLVAHREERCSAEVASTLRRDRLAGAGAAEIRLTELLRDRKEAG